MTVAVVTTACGGGTTTLTEVAAGPSGRCETTIPTPPATFPAAGSQVAVNIVAQRECSWTTNSSATWVQVSPSSGQGQAAITIAVSANPDPRSRTATIAINEARLSLAQDPAPCRYELGSSQSRMSQDGGQTSVSVTTSAGCTWQASSDASWARVNPATGTGNGIIRIEVSSNPGAERSATIRIANQALPLTQDARGATEPTPTPTPPPLTPTCSFTIGATDRSFGANGGDTSFGVTTTAGCAWSASTGANWIQLTASSGNGSGVVAYRVAPNTATTSRNADIAVAGRTHTVHQDGVSDGGGGGGGGQSVDIEGLALLVQGSCPSINFILELRRVVANGDTKFKHGNCGDVRTGSRVKVKGRAQSDSSVVASEIEIRDRD